MATFNKDGKQISPEEFDVAVPFGLLEKGADGRYLVAIAKDRKMAIFDENWNMVSPEWVDYIRPLGGDKKYVAIKDGNVAIFDLDGNQITEWQKIEKFAGNLFDRDKNGAKPETSKIEKTFDTTKKVYIAGNEFNVKHVKYYNELGILEIIDEQGNSTAIELKYKEDLELKKGLSAPGM